MTKKYQPGEIEPKWQKEWEKQKLYEFDSKAVKKKYYTLVELPYPSGDLHIGHWFTFATPDVVSRFRRMRGYDVFFPPGYDAFGLPAENAAIKRKVHPSDWTDDNMKRMTTQFKTMGSMLAWNHLTITCRPEYYHWNQWIFIKMFERGLAYRGKAVSNWCETDKTVLAHENVENGNCWRCGNPVVQKEVEQWFLKITDYADRLIWPDKPSVDWPKSVREGQNNWIGRKEGINITYKVKDSKHTITCFTTRPDTNFGATFIVLAPEHPFVKGIKDKKVQEYVDRTRRKSEMERIAEGRKKTGVFTGAYAINNLNGREMPIWISDFVLLHFGTGAVVGVPGHDIRDFEFAKEFGIEVIRVVVGKDNDQSEITRSEQVQEEEGIMINSGFLDGLDIHAATKKVMDWLVEKGHGKKVVNYKIHDWSISRQRYWGTPVPMIHCDDCGIVPVPERDLPVELPYEVDFTPTGKPPLATNETWMKVKCPKCKGVARRDAETLDTFFDSSWYYYRYIDPRYSQGPFDKAKVKKFLPVDVYFGGAEHTLGHTLYARFFTKFFKDIGLVAFDEFAAHRIQHGNVLGPDGAKMSKSRGNVINPDDMVGEYGADTVRLYLCFMMPYEATAPWSTEAIAGMYRFLQRVWRLGERVKGKELNHEDKTIMHKTIKKVTDDLEAIKCNTAIAAMMEWINYLSRRESISQKEYETFLKLLAPFAPHITEELWSSVILGTPSEVEGNSRIDSGQARMTKSIHLERWPEVDEGALKSSIVRIPVQINGRVRTVLVVPADQTDEKSVVAQALSDEAVKRHLAGQNPKIIYVKGKILNLVV